LKNIKGRDDLHFKDYKKENKISQNSQWFKTIKKIGGVDLL
jgi:hypothetical protein